MCRPRPCGPPTARPADGGARRRRGAPAGGGGGALRRVAAGPKPAAAPPGPRDFGTPAGSRGRLEETGSRVDLRPNLAPKPL